MIWNFSERITTKVVHNDRQDTIEHGSLHKPIHANVAYGYDDAKELAAVFSGRKNGYSYGRQVNPTVSALESNSVMETALPFALVLAWPQLVPHVCLAEIR